MMTFKGGICQILDLTSDPDLHKKCLDDVLCQEKLITDQCKLDQAERLVLHFACNTITYSTGKLYLCYICFRFVHCSVDLHVHV